MNEMHIHNQRSQKQKSTYSDSIYMKFNDRQNETIMLKVRMVVVFGRTDMRRRSVVMIMLFIHMG